MKEDRCPKCSNSEIKKGIIHAGNGVVHMFPYDNPKSRSSPLTSYYCSECGYVLAIYVENPKNLEK
ncbi:PF20097 family protein [Bacillus sp. B1-b2]|uniref:PF20097 family protein n=1 Tax=Bacillus sp. B1-b2 TaxID=2653201 RepID=UPI00126151D7|nr:PF20097 family protein [Bacillus sp. B1-b2]KAB7673194.1 acetyltransferase [Bacillus sp. B1-b2]